jgi:hypothetical protein
MTNRRRASSPRAGGIGSQATVIAARARKTLEDRTTGHGTIYAQQIRPARRHNPFATLGHRSLTVIEYAGLAVILGLGFGYLAPAITWPLQIPHMAAIAGIVVSCMASYLAIDRIADNAERLTAIGRLWSIDETGITVTGYDLPTDAITLGFIRWDDVAVADVEDGQVLLINAAGEVLSEIENHVEHGLILATIQRHRTGRADDAFDANRGHHFDPRFDLPENLDEAVARRPLRPSETTFAFDGPGSRDRRIEPIVPMPVLAMQRQDDERFHESAALRLPLLEVQPGAHERETVLDAVFVEVEPRPIDVALRTIVVEPHDAEVVVALLSETLPERMKAVPDVERHALVLPDDTRMEIFARGYEPDPVARRIELAVEETFRSLFETIPAEVVPALVAQQRAATVDPVPLDESRVLASNEDASADTDEAVMRRVVDQLVATAKSRGLDPKAFLQESLEMIGASTAANADRPALVSEVA